MNIDSILEKIGTFGPLQKRVFILLFTVVVFAGFHLYLPIYQLTPPPHRCAIPGYPNDTYVIQSSSHEEMINKSIPFVHTSYGSEYDQCHIYTNDFTSHPFDYNVTTKMYDARRTRDCNKWVFDQSQMRHSIAMKLNLVCKNTSFLSHLKMVMLVGTMGGSWFLGLVADYLGRKKVLMFACAVMLIAGTVNGITVNFVALCFCQFFVGACISSICICSFVMCMELVGRDKRMCAGSLLNFSYFFCAIILSGLAYVIRNCLYLQLAISLPFVLCVFYLCLLPESARWLLSQGKTEQALVILQKYAKSNGKTLPDYPITKNPENPKPASAKLWHICMTKALALQTAVVCLSWGVVLCAYFGIALSAGTLHKNLFLGSFLSSLMDLPGNILCILLLDRLGRKKLFATVMVVGGGANLCTIFTEIYATADQQWMTMSLVLLSKIGVSAAYSIIYLFTSELYPTVLRSGVIGVTSLVGRIGGIVSPYIIDIGNSDGSVYAKAVPFVILGTASIFCGCISLLLPETSMTSLPDTVDDAVRNNENNRGTWVTSKKEIDIIIHQPEQIELMKAPERTEHNVECKALLSESPKDRSDVK